MSTFLITNSDLPVGDREVLEQSVYNGQLIVQGLASLRRRLFTSALQPSDEYLISYFTEQADLYISHSEAFFKALQE